MRLPLAILGSVTLAAGAHANPCWCGPAYYVVPYWVAPVPGGPKAVIRENTEPPLARPADDIPRIANPRLPTEDVAPRKVLPIPKSVPKEEPRAKEKAVSVDQFLIPAERARAEAPAEVKVGIFNHSDRELDLEINGEAVKLPADQYVTLKMPRTFTWAVKGQPAKSVTVPADSDGLEIVFRR